MTQTEWLQCSDPRQMLQFLRSAKGASRNKVGRRKLRLFACACLRGIWPLLRRPESRNAVEIAERFADGFISNEALAKAYVAARQALASEPLTLDEPHNWHWQPAEAATHVVTRRFDDGDHPSVAHAHFSAATAWATHESKIQQAIGLNISFDEKMEERDTHHAVWLRDIFGNPFRPVSINPVWLTPTVTALAKTIYDNRRFEDMPILADALEESGCTTEDILQHCRGGGEHVRGCWVVDLLLKKK